MSEKPKDLRSLGAIVCLAGMAFCFLGGVTPFAIIGVVLIVVGVRIL
jgi:hypothetical protein